MTRDDVVVITGGSAGIGRAAALAFARAGAKVAVLARGADRVQQTCAEIAAAGGSALGVALDVADAAAVEAAAERIERELGPITVWVNNAMVTAYAPLVEMSADEVRRITEVTYLGTVHGTLAALKRMRARDRGTIVQVGSALAYRSIPLQSAYCAAKAAVRGLTDALRSELIRERSRVHVTMLQLSAFNTPQFDWARNRMPKRPQPVPPIFQPEVAARVIVRAAEQPRREWWVGWPAVQAILSSRLVPGLGDRIGARRAWDGQQSDEPATGDRLGNLVDAVPGSQAAHGRFDARSKADSRQLWWSMHRAPIALAAVASVVLMLAMRRGRLIRRGQAMKRRRLLQHLPLLVAFYASMAAAQQTGALVDLINDFRASPHRCDGKPAPIAGPLTPDAALANVPASAGGQLQEALQAAGYAATRSVAITLSGPRDAAAAMRLLAEHYCGPLSSPRYSEIGVARNGDRWSIVLAQPVLSPDLGSSGEAGMRVLELVNAARAEPRNCGDRRFAAVPPVEWNATLAATALAHSSDMAQRNYFAHAAPDGGAVGDRATRHGYDWRAIGENIAAGQGSPRQVVAGWLSSAGHCANIMSGDFTEMGAAYAVNRDSTSTIYWTQVFGSTRVR